MRIIAGEFRGRKLLSPATDATRPITDRVKQSLFDIITPRIPGATVYDCFAGTGSMGLESLSRGAKKVIFFELDKSAVKLLRQNIATLKVEDRSQVIAADIFRHFTAKATFPSADLIFLDPPYRFLAERSKELQKLARSLATQMNPDGVLIFRHDAGDHLELSLDHLDRRTYGNMELELLRSPSAQ